MWEQFIKIMLKKDYPMIKKNNDESFPSYGNQSIDLHCKSIENQLTAIWQGILVVNGLKLTCSRSCSVDRILGMLRRLLLVDFLPLFFILSTRKKANMHTSVMITIDQLPLSYIEQKVCDLIG